MYASHHGRVEVVTYLVENGADLLIADGKGQTALILAASSNNIAILSAVYDVSRYQSTYTIILVE